MITIRHMQQVRIFTQVKKCYTLTIDGWGDNSSSKLFYTNNGNFKEIVKTNNNS